MPKGAPRGNQNAAKGTEWKDALRKALAQYETAPDAEHPIKRGEALAKIAERCVFLALLGDKDARQEVANRLDGKPKEHVQVDQNITVDVGHAETMETALRKRTTGFTQPPVRSTPH